MKKQLIMVVFPAAFLAACSAPVNQPQAPLDTQAVAQYNAKVYSGNTVPTNQRVKYSQTAEMPLNKSDNSPRQSSVPRVNPNISVGVGYGGWGRPWW